jgi:putative two-component system response regulator
MEVASNPGSRGGKLQATREQDAVARILVVDDEESVRRVIARQLTALGYETADAGNLDEARAALDAQGAELVLCDMTMPGGSGLELVDEIVVEHPDTAIVMVTGLDDPGLARLALDMGAYGYVIKPFRASELQIGVANALRRRALEIEARAHRDRLERTVSERTEELERTIASLEASRRELRVSQEETVRRLAYAAEYRDAETGRHVERMSRFCELIGRGLGFDEERCHILRAASPMHDIGKIGIPDAILMNPEPLTPLQWRVMRRHSEIGYRILQGSESDILELAATIALTHHERLDGSGYPAGLRGDEIPLEGRIAAVADVFDAVTNDRVYQRALPLDQAIDVISQGNGSLFDQDVVEVFLDSLDDVLAIRANDGDPVAG